MGIRDRIELYNKITEEDVTEGILQVIRDNEAAGLDLNIAQLQKGQDALGKKIKPPYSPKTKEYKKFKNQPIDKVTLYDQGDFYRGFFMEAISFPVFFNSSDLKTGFLAEKYGFIFGLDRESQREFNQSYLKAGIQDFYRKLLYL